MKRNTKGFTLAELLIVVAIIAVLVGIAIPVFTSQLEKSREATDLANVRSAYAEVMTAALTQDETMEHEGTVIYNNGIYSADIKLVQKKVDWQTETDLVVSGISKAEDFGNTWLHIPLDKNTNIATVTYDPESNITVIDWNGGKAYIPHIYEFDEGYNFDELNTSGGKRYIVITDSPSQDDYYRHTAIKKLFDVDSNDSIVFKMPDENEAKKYLDIDNYSYVIGAEFVNSSKTMPVGDRTAYLSTGEFIEKKLDFNETELVFKTNSGSGTKSMIDLCKMDKDGKNVALTVEEIDYIMSLYKK